jgi:prepilin-type N-terminal cleavage/methylation domain-containing protein
MDSSFSKGFTLLEMLVSLFIVGVILSTVTYNNQDLSTGIDLTNQTHEVGLSVREAQKNGLSVKGHNGDTDLGYGVGFEYDTDNYFSFVDLNQLGYFDSSNGGEELERIPLRRRVKVSDICSVATTFAGDDKKCVSTGWSGREVDIAFVRPESNAILTFYNSIGVEVQVPGVFKVSVEFEAPNGGTQCLSVYKVGQISIENSC